VEKKINVGRVRMNKKAQKKSNNENFIKIKRVSLGKGKRTSTKRLLKTLRENGSPWGGT